MSAQDVFSKIAWSVGFQGDQAMIGDGSAFSGQVLSLMNEAGDDIARRAEWSAMYRTATIAPNLSETDLPADFYQMAESGSLRANVENGDYTAFRRIVAPEHWEMLQARPSSQPYYHLAEGKLQFSPDSGPDGVFMRYQSRFWIDQDKPRLTAATDTIRFPEHLLHRNTVWRWRRQKGLSYTDLLAEYEADLQEAISADRGIG